MSFKAQPLVVLLTFGILCVALGLHAGMQAQSGPMPVARVKPCEDFEVNGRGDAAAWSEVPWVALEKRTGSQAYASRFKLLYSKRGLYILFDGQDSKITATLQEDFADLWNEDVFEAFLWPSEKHTVYFEYEISPLGYELPILVPNLDGRFMGWRPWHYEGGRKVRKAVHVEKGESAGGAGIRGWRAEVFIPYELLKPLHDVPPRPGSRWRANFYRMDYDQGAAAWSWARVGPSFHDYRNFGTLLFE